MNRRDSVVALLAAAMAGSSDSAHAQSQGAREPFVIALLPDFMPNPIWAGWLKVITDGLRDLGRIEGRDYVIHRSGEFYGPEYQVAVDRTLEAKPDLILVVNLGYAVTVHKVNKLIPIVLLNSGFPVEAGVANSLAHPGKNVTGMTLYTGGEFFGKLVHLVHGVKPSVKRIGVFLTYVPPFHPQHETDVCIAGMRDAADSLGLNLQIFKIGRAEDVDTALAAVVAQRLEAMVLTAGISLVRRRKDVLDLATARRLPTIADSVGFTNGFEQTLLGYQASIPTLMRQAVPYIEQILWHGAKPGDLPIQLPARFEFVVNLKTAKAIGITVPPSILVRADRVIE